MVCKQIIWSLNSTFTSAMLDWTVAVTKNRGGVLGNNKLFIFKAPIDERVILTYRTVEVSTLVLQCTGKNWCQTWSKGPFSLNPVLKVSLRTRLKNILERLISIDCKIHHWTVSDWQPKLIEYSNNVCWIYINYRQIIIFYHWCMSCLWVQRLTFSQTCDVSPRRRNPKQDRGHPLWYKQCPEKDSCHQSKR